MVQASHYSACHCSLGENTFYNTLLGQREGLLEYLACNMKAKLPFNGLQTVGIEARGIGHS